MMNEDPFNGMNAMMLHFDSMMNGMFSSALSAFPSASRQPLQSEFPFSFGFPNVDASATHPNCHAYTSSQVMSMAVGPDGRQEVYQASASTKALPGGIRETKKTLCDSRSGVKKMSLEHHIGKRGRVIGHQKNLYSGEEEEIQEFINLDEKEAEGFDREFEQRVMMNGKHTAPAAVATSSSLPVRRPRNRSKGNATLTPELLPLTGHRFNSGESQYHKSLKSPKSPVKGNKGIIKGGFRKLRK